MPVSQPRPQALNGRLGSPTLAINASPAYLRHRVAAERAYRERRRRQRLRRIVLLCVAVILYFTIGREFMRFLRSQGDLASARVRGGLHTATSDVDQLKKTLNVEVTELTEG